MPPQTILLKQTRLKQSAKIKQQSDINKNITNKEKTQQQTTLRPLGEILVRRLSLRVQLDETIKLYTKAVKIYLYTANLERMTGMGEVFEHLSDKSYEIRSPLKMNNCFWFGLVQTTIHFAL